MLEPTFDEHETKPFATGGFSYVYKATLNGRPVVAKALKVTTVDLERKVHKVSGLVPKASTSLLTLDLKLLVREVVGWKWLRHDNILPFVGVVLTSPLLSIISERMENGNIMEFVRNYPNQNRLRLVSEERVSILPSH